MEKVRPPLCYGIIKPKAIWSGFKKLRFECRTQNMPEDVVESYFHLVSCVNTSTTISMKTKNILHKLAHFNLNCHVWMGCDAK